MDVSCTVKPFSLRGGSLISRSLSSLMSDANREETGESKSLGREKILKEITNKIGGVFHSTKIAVWVSVDFRLQMEKKFLADCIGMEIFPKFQKKEDDLVKYHQFSKFSSFPGNFRSSLFSSWNLQNFRLNDSHFGKFSSFSNLILPW